MRTLIYRAAGLIVKDLIGILGRHGVTDAWVVGSAVGDPGVESYKPDLVLGLFTQSAGPSSDWFTGSASRSAGLQNTDVALRLGAALAQGIPTLLVVPPGAAIPHRFGALLIAQCEIDDNDALNSALAPFFFSRGSSGITTTPPALNTSHRDDLREQLRSVQSATDTDIGSLGVLLLRDTLFAIGTRFAENPLRDDDGVDFALIPTPVSNEPLFVTLKVGELSEPALVEAEIRLQNSVVARGGGIGLLLYIDLNNESFPQLASMPLIIRMSYEDFLDQLTAKPLPRVIDERVEEAIERL